jgi:UDP-glucose 4-epimerase
MQGLLNVLEAGRMFGVRRVTVASSITVYAGLSRGPFEEGATLPMESRNSTEGYKKAWEILALLYGAQTGLDVQMLRLGGIYGPLYHSMANLASRLTHAAVRSRPLDLAAGRGGVPFDDDDNDWCYVKDCAEGIRRAYTAESLPHPIYNIGGGVGASNHELVDAVRAVAPQFEAKLQPGRNPRARQNNFMDLARTKAEIGYAPEYDVRRGIADYASWLKANPE